MILVMEVGEGRRREDHVFSPKRKAGIASELIKWTALLKVKGDCRCKIF